MGTQNTKFLNDDNMNLSHGTGNDKQHEYHILDQPIRHENEVVHGQFDDAVESVTSNVQENDEVLPPSCTSMNETNLQEEKNFQLDTGYVNNQVYPLLALHHHHHPPGSILFLAPPFCYLPLNTPAVFYHPPISHIANVEHTLSNKRDDENQSYNSSSESSIEHVGDCIVSTSTNKDIDNLSSVSSSQKSNIASGPVFANPSLTINATTDSGTITTLIEYNKIANVKPLLCLDYHSQMFDSVDREHPDLSLLPSSDSIIDSPIYRIVVADETNHIGYNNLTIVDILLGRGSGTYINPGNIWFRYLMGKYRKAYCIAPKYYKGLLTKNLCNYIRLKGGRFLEQKEDINIQQNIHNNLLDQQKLSFWYECGDIRAQAKIGQTLRENIKGIAKVNPIEEKGITKEKPIEDKVISKVKPIEDKVIAKVIPIEDNGIAKVKPLLSQMLESVNREHPDLSLLPCGNSIIDKPVYPVVERDDTNLIEYNNLTTVDILLGRGGGTNSNPGNIWFRKLMEKYRKEYCTAAKFQKCLLTKNLCNYIRSKGGRFLEQKEDINTQQVNENNINNLLDQQKLSFWYECGDIRAQAKIGQTLREGIATIVRETLKRNLKDSIDCHEGDCDMQGKKKLKYVKNDS